MDSRVIDTFCRYMRLERGCSASSIAKYRSELKRLQVFLQNSGLTHIEETSHIDLRSYLYERAGELSRSTYATVLATLKSFFKFMVNEELIARNPTAKLSFPRKSGHDKLPSFLDQNAQQCLYQYLIGLKRNFTNDRNRSIIFMFLYTGMRTSELCSLLRESVATNAQTIVITRKGGKQQALPLSRELVKLLETYWKPWYGRIKSEAYFCTKQGTPMTPRTVWHLVSRALQQAGIEGVSKQGAHVLRHTFATNLVRQRANLIEIQNLLGHTDVRMTQIYTHVTPESLRSTVNLLEGTMWQEDLPYAE